MKTKSILVGIRRLLFGVLVTVSPLPRTLAADLHVPSEYATIQEAVDAASSGDTIRIAAGDYYEQIAFRDRTLTLAGEPGEPGTVLHAFSEMVPKGPSLGFSGTVAMNAISILATRQSHLVLSNLTFDGAGLGDLYPTWLWGIILAGTSARIENCTIKGFRGASQTFARGISVNNRLSIGAPVVNVSVVNSTFLDNVESMLIFGDPDVSPDLLRTTFSLEGNTFVGLGPTFAHRGVYIITGAGGEVRGNTMTGYSRGTGSGFSAAIVHQDGNFATRGFLPVQPVRYEGNTFSNNDDHLVLFTANESTVVNNIFHGIGPGGHRWGGLAVSGTNIVVANNDFYGMPNGILLFGNEVLSGQGIKPASNVSLNANWFCDVSNPVSTGLGATDIQEQGTQTCPFRPLLQCIADNGSLASLDVRSWHGQPVVLEASTNLQHWAPIHTNMMALPTFKYQDPAGLAQRFYRGVVE
jgi:hypothetical protein